MENVVFTCAEHMGILTVSSKMYDCTEYLWWKLRQPKKDKTSNRHNSNLDTDDESLDKRDNNDFKSKLII